MRRGSSNGPSATAAFAISRHGRTVAFVVSTEQMEAILETLEITTDQRMMKSIRDFGTGKAKTKPFNPDEI